MNSRDDVEEGPTSPMPLTDLYLRLKSLLYLFLVFIFLFAVQLFFLDDA